MRVVITVLMLVLVSCAGQQGDPPATADGPAAVVSMRSVSPARVSAGDTVELALTLEIAEGFHIQANPASQPYLIPAVLELDALAGLELGDPVYPPGTPYRIHGADEDLSTYGGELTIRVPVSVSPGAAPGERALLGTFRYQACDARHCLAPTSIAIEHPVLLR